MWEQSRSDEYVDQINSNISSFNDIIDSIISGDIHLNTDIKGISKCMYSTEFSLFGKTVKKHSSRNFKSQWFNRECVTDNDTLYLSLVRQS